MLKFLFSAFALAFSAVLLPSVSLAQETRLSLSVQPCFERSKILQFLKNKHSKSSVAVAVTREKSKVWELLLSDGGNWTILETIASGLSCEIMSGDDWIDKRN